MPLFVALIAMAALKETLSITRKVGLALILAGVVVIVTWHNWDGAWSMSRSFGDALFLLASLLSAAFTVRMRQAKLEPLHAAALGLNRIAGDLFARLSRTARCPLRSI